MLDQALAIVKKVQGLYESSAKSNPGNTAFTTIASELRTVMQCLEEQQRLSIPITKELGDLSDLPEALIKELSLPPIDELESQILVVMRACEGGDANLDQILVGLFRKFKVVQQRRFLQNKLYRMTRKGILYQVPGQRAVYTLTPPPAPHDEFVEIPEGEEESASSQIRANGHTQAEDMDDEIPF